VEMRESPLSKVVVPMPKVTAVIGKQEARAAFQTRIAAVVNRLIGNYCTMEHTACVTLRHGRLNRVFELADMSYRPRPEPLAHAMKKQQPRRRKRRKLHPTQGTRPLSNKKCLLNP
jgi:hypothetical protein